MREHEREEVRRKEEERMEAEEARRLAAEFEAEQRRLQEMRREVATKQAADNLRQIDDIELMKQIDRMQEEVVNLLERCCCCCLTGVSHTLIIRDILSQSQCDLS